MFLFLDTSKFITIGLLNLDLEWLGYKFIESNKSSSVLHFEVQSLLEKNNLKISELAGIIYSTGPGSYTGMRVGQGFVETCSLVGIKNYSFYHFEIPQLLNVESGIWVDEAFKGEVFTYSWNKDNSNKELIPKEKFKFAGKVYSGFGSYEEFETILTKDLIYKNSKKIFSSIISRDEKLKLYYYRSLEKEFGKNE